MRNQQQGTGTLPFNMAAYECEPLDVIQFTFGPLQMTDQALEITNFRFAIKTDDDGVESRHIEPDVVQTDISVYGWSIIGRADTFGAFSPQINNAGHVATPTLPAITDSAGTAYVGPDGAAQSRAQRLLDGTSRHLRESVPSSVSAKRLESIRIKSDIGKDP
jgi:hypothetical protein